MMKWLSAYVRSHPILATGALLMVGVASVVLISGRAGDSDPPSPIVPDAEQTTLYYKCLVKQQDFAATAEQMAACPHDGVYQCAPDSPDFSCPEGYFGWTVGIEGIECTPAEGIVLPDPAQQQLVVIEVPPDQACANIGQPANL